MERQTGRFAEGRGERERGGERGVEAAVSDVAEEAAETLRKKAGKGRTRRQRAKSPRVGTTGLSRESKRSCAKSEDLSDGRHSRSMLRERRGKKLPGGERREKKLPATAVRGSDALDVKVGGGRHIAPGEAAAERESVGGRGELRRETCGREGDERYLQ